MSTNRLQAQDTASPRVVIASARPVMRISGLLTAATRTGGWGGWEVIDRVRQTGFVEWAGVEPARMSLTILLDGWSTGKDQEPFIRNLHRMASPVSQQGGQPPPISITGPVPADRSMRWVIANLAFDDENQLRSPRDGHRLRQQVTLELLQYVTPELAFSRSAAQRRALARDRVTTVTSVKDDTIAKIAKRVFGDVGRWTAIRDLNPKLPRDPRKPIKTGTRVRVPAQ